ncbi:RQC-minor-2 family DNA-binding protein [Rossellomorea marisflavi]|uniref:RQC-minor-2 family DNA-binding protein n=1 Tax=Rossellomorea marisflavi TaxID=189381 RepID=UPI00345840D3
MRYVELTDYPSLLIIPVGRKFPEVRSIGHKKQRGLLSRLQHAVDGIIEEGHAIQAFFPDINGRRLPVPIYRKEELYPHLIRPESFLWKKHSDQRGLPIEKDSFYSVEYETLSAQDLEAHVQRVMTDYSFAAILQERKRDEWLESIRSAYSRHPFIELARTKQDVVKAVEILNSSSLLGLLNSPEDVAFWRHRVEIVLRPYRNIPLPWRWDICRHEKELTLKAKEEILSCTCHECNYTIDYYPEEDRVTLPTEVNMEQARKRIATIERQFNDMAEKTTDVVTAIRRLQDLKAALRPLVGMIERARDLEEQLGGRAASHPILSIYQSLKGCKLPDRYVEPDLMSLSLVHIPDISLLKTNLEGEDFQQTLEDHLSYLERKEQEYRPSPDDVMVEVKGYGLTRGMIEDIEGVHGWSDIPVHLLVQILKGEATSKIRRMGLNDTTIFAMLSSWPAKYITQAMIQWKKSGA